MPKRDRPGSVKSQISNHDRPEPKLLRAVEANDLGEVTAVIQDANASVSLLSIGLARACDKGYETIARLLCQYGADVNYVSNNKLPSLLRAAESGNLAIAQLLVEYKADLEARDVRKGRTALMTAAWQNQLGIVKLLLQSGASVRTTDKRQRTVLHNVAADKVLRICTLEVVDELVDAGADLEARDETGRTPLHWSAVNGNQSLMRWLLAADANIEALDSRMKTPLHFAAWHDRQAATEMLLEHGANIHAESDGGWTALHYASAKGSASLIDNLLSAGANVNSGLLNGRTPLHVAAECGKIEAVARLLQEPHVKRAPKDTFGNTPLLIAAQHARKEIVEMLAPWNDLDRLTLDEKEACRRFEATIVDFGNFRNENKVSKRSVHDLLYSRNEVSTMPKQIKATKLRWIHLPANNIAWCDALLTRRFIEEGAVDVEGYKAMEAAFSQQHRGQKHHARFMRPSCSIVQRQVDNEDNSTVEKAEIPTVLVHDAANASITATPEPTSYVEQPIAQSSQEKQKGSNGTTPSLPNVIDDESTSLPSKLPENQRTPGRRSKRNAGAKEPTVANDRAQRVPVKKESLKADTPQKQSRSSTARSVTSTTRRVSNSPPCSIYLFMPYLHFESKKRRDEMQAIIESAPSSTSDQHLHEDEILIRAHLTASNSFLHIRRTLDQFFYHNIDTRLRDNDQVVSRYQQTHDSEHCDDPKIFMVDQLWMWVIGTDLVVTSFPRRWKQPRNDPLNVLDGIIEDINSKTRKPIENVYELAMTITARCYGNFDRKGGQAFNFFDMFEGSLGAAMDREAYLFGQFSESSRQASQWLQNNERPNRFSQPAFVDKLLDVGAETDLLTEIKDIRDELNIIRMILNYQEALALDFRKAIRGIYEQDRLHMQLRKLEKIFDEQDKTISNPLKDIDRMSDQAEDIYCSIRDLLDLKQKHANAFEARFARDQAAGTIRQGRTILVFTVVTVVFLPMSFIAAFFAINLQWPNPLTLPYVSEYIFGIGLGISIPCIIIAMTVDELGVLMASLKRRVGSLFGASRMHRDKTKLEATSNLVMIEDSVSVMRSMRRSMDNGWDDKAGAVRMENLNVGWTDLRGRSRPGRISWDVERGRH